MSQVRAAVGLLAFVVIVVSLGACTVDHQYSQTELNALQTREFDYSFDTTFDATVGALFDLNYTVHTSDKRAGLLGASNGVWGVQIKLDQAGPKRTSVRVSTIWSGQARVDKARTEEVLNMIDRRLTGVPAKIGGG